MVARLGFFLQSYTHLTLAGSPPNSPKAMACKPVVAGGKIFFLKPTLAHLSLVGPAFLLKPWLAVTYDKVRVPYPDSTHLSLAGASISPEAVAYDKV